jgi:hypothetical protein
VGEGGGFQDVLLAFGDYRVLALRVHRVAPLLLVISFVR